MEIMYEKIQTEKLMKRLSVWQGKIKEGKEEKNGSEKGTSTFNIDKYLDKLEAYKYIFNKDGDNYYFYSVEPNK